MPKLRTQLRRDSESAREEMMLQFIPKSKVVSFADMMQSRSDGFYVSDFGIVWQFSMTSPLELAERASKQLAASPEGKLNILNLEMSGRYYKP